MCYCRITLLKSYINLCSSQQCLRASISLHYDTGYETPFPSTLILKNSKFGDWKYSTVNTLGRIYEYTQWIYPSSRFTQYFFQHFFSPLAPVPTSFKKENSLFLTWCVLQTSALIPLMYWMHGVARTCSTALSLMTTTVSDQALNKQRFS